MEGKVTLPNQLTEREKEILERLSAGLSDQQISHELRLSLNTIKWYNRQIYSKLGVRNRTQASAGARKIGLFKNATLIAPELRHTPPQQPTSFIGRETEIADIVALLFDSACRLLTVVGPGGTGKTRLALEVMQQLDLADGMFFVPLQPLGSAENIVTTIVDALPLQLHGNTDPQQQLLNYLREKHILLILDNFEHLLDGVSIVTDILDAAPHVKLLVTSREALNLQAEHLWPLAGLDTPPDEALDIFDDYSAVQLFVERTKRVKPDFSPAAHRHEIVRICRLVDGLPLALELAASWTRALSPQAIGDEIERSIDFLATNQRDVPERHRSVRAVFDHSWRLLSDEEQAVFRKLSVFRGGFTLEAAEQAADASLSLLASLIDKSLLRLGENGRYDLHELLQQYTEAQLEAAGETETTRHMHSAHYADFVHRRVDDLKGRRQLEALAEISADFENVRTAWNWAARHRYKDHITALLEGLQLFCSLLGRHENMALFKYAEQQFVAAHRPDDQRIWGKLLARVTEISENAQMRLETALRIARQYDDRAEIAFCLRKLSAVAQEKHDYVTATQLLEESLAHCCQAGDRFYEAATLFALFTVHTARGSWEDCERYGRESLHLRGVVE